jgi:hypothetical protein
MSLSHGSQPPPPSAYDRVPPPSPTAYDGVSVAALVCALTWCAAPAAIVLGMIGLVRTSGGRRGGTWAAVTGLALGLVGTIAAVVLAAGLAIFWFAVPYEGEAVPGDCLEVTRAFDGTDLWWADCTAPHDAEVVSAGTFGPEGAAKVSELTADTWCREAVDPEVIQWIRDEELVLDLSTDAWDPEAPEAGDAWFCFAERLDGTKLPGRSYDGRLLPEEPLDA